MTGNDQNYEKSLFGLQKDDNTSYNAELSYAPGDNFNLFVFGDRMDRKLRQKGRQSGATPSTSPLDDWTANLDETTDTWGAGLTSKLATRWTLDLSANWSRSDGTADLFSPPGGTPDVARGFDNYDDIELFTLLGRIDYQINRADQGGPLRPLGGLHDRQLRAPGAAELPAGSAAAQSELRRLPGQHRRARHDPDLLSAVRAALFPTPP